MLGLARAGRQSLLRQMHTSRACSYAEVVPRVNGKSGKERLVILGSGWGAMALIKALDKVGDIA
jgi:hypothetical protein